MTTIHTIPSDIPEHTFKHKAHIWFDHGLIFIGLGHSSHAEVNFTFMYTNLIWGTKDEVTDFIKRNFAEPLLTDLGYVESEDEPCWYKAVA